MSEVVYQATVTTGDKKETYIGLTATQFKARDRNHLISFRHEKRRNETELSNCFVIFTLNRSNTNERTENIHNRQYILRNYSLI